LWACVLQLNESVLGIDDDFYISGRDSLSAIRLSSAARAAGVQLLATDIIRNPTIRAMARIAQSVTTHHHFDDDDIPSIMLIHMTPADLPLLVLNQGRLDFIWDKLLPEHGIFSGLVILFFPTLSLVHYHFL
jgi:aryl carrier-like protein